MRTSVIAICVLGSLAVGIYVANIFNTNYVLSQFKKPDFSELTIEQYKEFPHELLAEVADGYRAIVVMDTKMHKEQQEKLRHAILVLSVWSVFLLVIIVLSRTKALNKFSLPRPGKSPGAGLANARRS